MSKIGKKIVNIPAGVEISESDGMIKVKGKGGEITLKILPFIQIKKDGATVSFSIDGDSKQARSNWGTMRALFVNAVVGVSEGFTRILEIEGIGFKAGMEGENLVLSLGFSHPVKFSSPKGIKLTTEKNTIKISGIDKELVGQTAAKIRALKKPEPYKGKGIKYQGEIIRRKEGKKAAAASK